MVGLGPVRNQVSAAKKLQTPSRTATTIIMLVPFAAANKLLGQGRAGPSRASSQLGAARGRCCSV